MILDSLKNASAYYSLNPRFQKAFEYIMANDLTKAEPGKIVLDGDNLYISIAEIEGKKSEVAKLEAHKKYIDIQVVLCGQEKIGWTALENCTDETGPYNAEKDIVFYSNQPTTYITYNPGDFTIFFAEDGHAPAIGEGPIKKAIVKVLI
jgi:uncharacterized protein, YhcH/YjgK/YiaL family